MKKFDIYWLQRSSAENTSWVTETLKPWKH